MAISVLATSIVSCRGNDGNSVDVAGASAARQLQAPPPKIKPEGFLVDPKRLVHLDEAEVRGIMGTPTTTREEPPAVIWRFVEGDCRLELYFYQSLKSKKLRSLTYVLETTQPNTDAEKHCILRDG